MLCEQCNMREATIVVKEVINGSTTEHHLCAECAAEADFGMLFDEASPFAKLLTGILGLNTKEDEENNEAGSVSCPNCNTTFGDFIDKGRFGCAQCYDTFGLLIRDNIKKLQGSDTHVGKHPRYLGALYEHAKLVSMQKEEESLSEQLAMLTAKQQEAVQEEDYEAAAHYRDEIKALKERIEEGK